MFKNLGCKDFKNTAVSSADRDRLPETLGLNYEALSACICEGPIRKAIYCADLTYKIEGAGK